MPDPILKRRDQGDAVVTAQDLLNRDGGILDEDGDFGPSTERAVREFRRKKGLADVGVIDGTVWPLLRALPEPSPTIPTRAVAFIAREEVGGREFYDAHAVHPEWPGADSGVTIGVGYDLGFQANFDADWRDLLSPGDIAALRPWVGRKGDAAAPGPAQLTSITIPWAAAWLGYVRRTLPQQVDLTQRTLRVGGSKVLPPLCLGVMVSLIYNRGPAMSDKPGSDARKEMREVRDALAVGNFAPVASLLRSMARLWPISNGVHGRRLREAELFEIGLRAA